MIFDPIVQVKSVLPLPSPSDTVTVTWQVHSVVGVPEISPVDGSILSPAGSPLALNVKALPSGSLA